MTDENLELRREVDDLKQRVRELERIIDDELGYGLQSPVGLEPQYVDCPCGETFQVNIVNGLTCPNCGAGSEEREEA